jgi:glutathione peroxidase
LDHAAQPIPREFGLRRKASVSIRAVMPTLHDFKVKTIDGQERSLADYKGQVLLVVNVASQCGLTPQYTALEELHRKYQGRGFSVLGFPCNDFGAQEPGTEQEIKEFCSTKYDVTFPLFSKVHVKGDGQAPVYEFLTAVNAPPKGPGEVVWNFEKFVVDKSGNVVARFVPPTAALDGEVTTAIDMALSM